MKIIITLAVALVVTLTAVAIGLGGAEPMPESSPDRVAPAPAEGAPALAVTTMTTTADPEATALLERVAAAYRDAAAITDTMTVLYKTPSSEQESSYAVALGDGDSARMEMPGMVVTADGDQMYITTDRATHKYVAGEIRDGVGPSFRRISGSRNLPIHLSLRYEPSAMAMVGPIAFAQLQKPELDGGVEDVEVDGRTLRVFGIKGMNGTARVFVDPATHLLHSVTVNFTPQGVRNRAGYELIATFAPKVLATLPETIAFDPGDRFKVRDMGGLYRLSAGEPAPDFTLTTLDGESVTLSEQRGNVVVLDFWATWCGPCRKGLPLLERVHRWVVSTEQPVKIFGLNGYEKFRTAEEKAANAAKYWNEKGFTMPSLMDPGREAVGAYGFSSIPVTVVIDRQGRIAHVHTGFDPRMDQRLQQEIGEILASGG